MCVLRTVTEVGSGGTCPSRAPSGTKLYSGSSSQAGLLMPRAIGLLTLHNLEGLMNSTDPCPTSI